MAAIAISWQAHLGGLVTGAAVGFVYARTRARRQRNLQIWLLVAVTAVLIALLIIPAVVYVVRSEVIRFIPTLGMNDTGVIRADAAAQRQRVVIRGKPMEGDAEADDEVPPGDPRDRELLVGQVEDDDPDETEQHEADHEGLEPDGLGSSVVLAPLDDGLVALLDRAMPTIVSARSRPVCPG